MTSSRPEYTFKYNQNKGRYNWLRLTPAYSVKLVNELINDMPEYPTAVLDPFSGTATTPLTCSYRGIDSYALEINPFLHWMGMIKLKLYSDDMADTLLNEAVDIVSKLESNTCRVCAPNIYKIERWWRNDQLDFLKNIKFLIDSVKNPAVRDLLSVAFCKTLITISGAKFNHVSTSFGPNEDYFDNTIGSDCFINNVTEVANGLRPNPSGDSKIILHDSRSIPSDINYNSIITSPPYPNRISYIRELRPYMYWMGYLHEGSEAGILDWKAIGGTWGTATSKLNSWSPDFNIELDSLNKCLEKFDQISEKNGILMRQYVHKYFFDMYLHLRSVSESMNNGKIHYIIGNSTFYDVSVPSEQIYSEIMEKCNFKNIEIQIVRKRNSKKELFEYCVSGCI